MRIEVGNRAGFNLIWGLSVVGNFCCLGSAKWLVFAPIVPIR